MGLLPFRLSRIRMNVQHLVDIKTSLLARFGKRLEKILAVHVSYVDVVFASSPARKRRAVAGSPVTLFLRR
jgi:hypothetical protein